MKDEGFGWLACHHLTRHRHEIKNPQRKQPNSKESKLIEDIATFVFSEM
jgi:hypothetical protein